MIPWKATSKCLCNIWRSLTVKLTVGSVVLFNFGKREDNKDCKPVILLMERGWMYGMDI